MATTGSYEIPSEVADAISLVAGLNTFGAQLGVTTAAASAGPGVPASITPDTIYQVYGVDSSGYAAPFPLMNQSVAIAGKARASYCGESAGEASIIPGLSTRRACLLAKLPWEQARVAGCGRVRRSGKL